MKTRKRKRRRKRRGKRETRRGMKMRRSPKKSKIIQLLKLVNVSFI